MPIRVQCPRCQHAAWFADNDAGLVIACLSCGAHIVVPTPGLAGKPAADAAPARAPRVHAVAAGDSAPAHRRAAAATGRHATVAATAGAGSAPVATVTATTTAASPGPAKAPVSSEHGTAPLPVPETRPARRPGPAGSRWKGRMILLSSAGATTGVLLLLGTIIALVGLYLRHPGGQQASSTRPSSVSTAATRVATASAAPAVVPVPPPPPPMPRHIGFVALERVELHGTQLLVDSYNSREDYEDSASDKAVLAGNAYVTISTGTINGQLRLGPSADLKMGKKVKLSSTMERLHEPITAPSFDGRAAAEKNDNALLPKGNFTNGTLNFYENKEHSLPAGTYYLRDLIVTAHSQVQCQGPVTFVVAGKVDLLGNVIALQERPGNIRIRMAGAGNVVISGKSECFLDLYAPQSAVNISGSGDLYGAILCRTLSVSGSRRLHFDESLQAD